MSEPIQPANRGEIEALEQREATAMLRGDVAELEALWSDHLIVNSSVNLIAGKQLLLEWIRSGRLRLRTFERHTTKLAGTGDLVVATGSETSQLVSERVPDEPLLQLHEHLGPSQRRLEAGRPSRRPDRAQETRALTAWSPSAIGSASANLAPR